MTELSLYLDQIKARLTLSEIVGQDRRLSRKGHEYIGLCPFHEEKTPSFKVNDQKGYYHCFGCGAHGDAFSYVMHRSNMQFMEAVKELADKTGVSLPDRSQQSYKEKNPRNQDLYALLEEACSWFQHVLTTSVGEDARDYLRHRGFIPDTVRQFRLGFASSQHNNSLYGLLVKKGFSKDLILSSGLIIVPEDQKREPYDRFRDRLMFPILDAKGRVIAFGGRLLREGQPKYLNSSDSELFHKGQVLYGYSFAQNHVSKDHPYLLVEGYCDVIALHQAGFKTAIAPLGTAVTAEQLHLLWRRSPEPILCFDGDEAGTRASFRTAQRALPFLATMRTLNFCFLPKGEDPDSLLRQGSPQLFRDILQKKIPLAEVLWKSHIENGAVVINATPEQKATLKKQLAETVAQITDNDIRYFYQTDFNERFRNLWYKSYTRADQPRKFQSGKFKDFRSKESESDSSQGNDFIKDGLLYKKSDLAQKILLAILVNHPTLVSEVAEQLAALEFNHGEWQKLKVFLLEYADDANDSFEDCLAQHGLLGILDNIFDRNLYNHAPYAAKQTDPRIALEGWLDIWDQTVHRARLKEDLESTYQDVKTSFNDKDWQRLKALKSNLFKQT
ncbi:MAG: DNA primase [Alphaproteobacteria bacterium]|nr:DNA primase [Alphaproteobacteria bacterium]